MKRELTGLESERIELPAGFVADWNVMSGQRWLHIRNGRLLVEGPDGHSRIAAGGLALVPIGVRHRVSVLGARSVEFDLLRVRNRAFAQSNTIDRQAAQFLLALAEYAKSNNYRLKLPPKPRSWVQQTLGELSTYSASTMAATQNEESERVGSSALMMKGLFLTLLGRLSALSLLQDVNVPEGKVDPSWHIRKVLAYVDEHVDEAISINQAAAIAGFGRTRFIANFKVVTGMSFAAYVTKVRLGKAAQLLKHSRMGVLEIVFDCGFGSVSRFMKHSS